MSGAKTEYLLNSLPAARDVSDEQVRAARVRVAANAHDHEDCSELLDMLGIGKVVEL